MVLMVDFSSRNSPFTSTVIFLDRSPFATAVVTSATFRTCPVRLAAIMLTLSVRSFQVPATPFTCACPPSFPSVPTSRATRVSSDVTETSCSTMVLTFLAVRRNSPWSGRPSISSAMFLDRSPLATAPMTRAISVVGWIMSVTSVLMLSTQVSQPPDALPSLARWLILPSLPMATLSRLTSLVRLSFISTTSLKTPAISPSSPVRSSGSRTEKSPLRNCRNARSRVFGSRASTVVAVIVHPFRLQPGAVCRRPRFPRWFPNTGPHPARFQHPAPCPAGATQPLQANRNQKDAQTRKP